jgi:hypothetical protein
MKNLLRPAAAFRFLATTLLTVASAVSSAFGANLNVTTTQDVIDSHDGLLSLREAVVAANAAKGPMKINVPAGTYSLALPGTDEDASFTGDLDVSGTVTITGAGADSTFVDGAGLDRIFDVLPGADVVLSGLTIQGGFTEFEGGGIRVESANLKLVSCAVVGNQVDSPVPFGSNRGGGISAVAAQVTIQDSTISLNQTSFPGTGGGIFIDDGSNVAVNNCTLSYNDAGVGGAICAGFHSYVNPNVRELDVTGSVFTQNTASAGAGIALFQRTIANVRSSTFFRNTCVGGVGGGFYAQSADLSVQGCDFHDNDGDGGGGGIYAYTSGFIPGTLDVQECTFTNNIAGGGGGIFWWSGNGVGNMRNCTLTENSALSVGGGIAFFGTGSICDSLVLGNAAPVGGDLYNLGAVLSDDVIGDIAP